MSTRRLVGKSSSVKFKLRGATDYLQVVKPTFNRSWLPGFHDVLQKLIRPTLLTVPDMEINVFLVCLCFFPTTFNP